MKKPKIQVKTDGIFAKILFDEKDVSNQLTGVRYTHEAGCVPGLKFDYLGKISLETKQVPPLPDILKPYYISKTDLIQSGFVTEEQLKVIE